MKQIYEFGVQWLAANDSADSQDALDWIEIATHTSTLLLAEMTGMLSHCVAKDIVACRKKLDFSGVPKIENVNLYIYNRNCPSAGKRVPEYELAKCANPESCNIWANYGGTESKMVDYACNLFRGSTDSGAVNDGVFFRNVARTILESLSWSGGRIDRTMRLLSGHSFYEI